MLQEKNGALEGANAELQKAAEAAKAAHANLQQKATSFDELKVLPVPLCCLLTVLTVSCSPSLL